MFHDWLEASRKSVKTRPKPVSDLHGARRLQYIG